MLFEPFLVLDLFPLPEHRLTNVHVRYSFFPVQDLILFLKFGIILLSHLRFDLLSDALSLLLSEPDVLLDPFRLLLLTGFDFKSVINLRAGLTAQFFMSQDAYPQQALLERVKADKLY